MRLCSFLFALLKRVTKSALLFCSLQKEQQRANRSFALDQKSDKEKIALVALLKRATRENHSFALAKRVTKSESLFTKREKE